MIKLTEDIQNRIQEITRRRKTEVEREQLEKEERRFERRLHEGVIIEIKLEVRKSNH